MRNIVLTIILFAILAGCKGTSRQNIADDSTSCADTFAVDSMLLPTTNDSVSDSLPNDVPETSSSQEICNLDSLQDYIGRKLSALKGNPLAQNIYATGQEEDAVIIYLSINTEYWREQFRHLITASSHIKFEGKSKPTKIDIKPEQLYVGDSIRLVLGKTSYPVTDEEIDFTITNIGERTILFGEDYIVAYRGDEGCWYRLPNPGIWYDLGYSLGKGAGKSFSARLHPALNRNKPGIYRLYKDFRFENEKSCRWLMTEFELSPV